MSSLQRYKKTGGFVQLLSLIETFGPQKKDKFLEMIDQESVVWGSALREKMLTLERIFQWPDEVLIEVFKAMPLKNQALALQGIKEEVKARIMKFMSSSEKRRLDDVINENPPKPDELASNMIKVIEITRKMLQSGEIRPEKFDAALMVPEEFEHKLEGQLQYAGGNANAAANHGEVPANGHSAAGQAHGQTQAAGAAHAAGQANGHHADAHHDNGHHPPPQTLDQAQMQRTLAMLVRENKALKEEVRILREKLDQIKRIA